MKVKMLKTAAGEAGIYPVGAEVDLERSLALAFVEDGAAKAVEAEDTGADDSPRPARRGRRA